MSSPILPVCDVSGRNSSPWEMIAAMNCGGGFGGGMNGWASMLPLWLLVLLFGGGWGGFGGFGGFGNRGGFGGCGGFGGVGADLAVTNATDTAELKAGVNYIAQTQVGQTNLMGQIKDNLCAGFAGVNASINNAAFQNQLGQRDLQAQIADCCCKTQTSIAAVNNNISQQFCQLNYNNAMQNCELKQAIAAEGAATRQLLLDQQTEALRERNADLKNRLFIMENFGQYSSRNCGYNASACNSCGC